MKYVAVQGSFAYHRLSSCVSCGAVRVMDGVRDFFGKDSALAFISSQYLVLFIDGVRVSWYESTQEYRISVYDYGVSGHNYVDVCVLASSCRMKKLIANIQANIAAKILAE